MINLSHIHLIDDGRRMARKEYYTLLEIGGDFSKQGHYLNNAKGTMQGSICE